MTKDMQTEITQALRQPQFGQTYYDQYLVYQYERYKDGSPVRVRYLCDSGTGFDACVEFEDGSRRSVGKKFLFAMPLCNIQGRHAYAGDTLYRYGTPVVLLSVARGLAYDMAIATDGQQYNVSELSWLDNEVPEATQSEDEDEEVSHEPDLGSNQLHLAAKNALRRVAEVENALVDCAKQLRGLSLSQTQRINSMYFLEFNTGWSFSTARILATSTDKACLEQMREDALKILEGSGKGKVSPHYASLLKIAHRSYVSTPEGIQPCYAKAKPFPRAMSPQALATALAGLFASHVVRGKGKS